jgi:hypothetical protein
MLEFPEYEAGAKFKYTEACGTFRRDQCHTHNGRLLCPKCHYIGTLRFISATPVGAALTESV